MGNQRLWSEDIETRTLSELRTLQEWKLRRQLDYVAANSPFYQKLYADASVDIDKIVSVHDLHLLPFITKDHLRQDQGQNPPLGSYACAPVENVRRLSASSGTSGSPILVGLTAEDKEVWSEILARVVWAQGLRPGMTAWNACTLGFWISGVGFQWALEDFGAVTLPAGNTEHARAFHIARKMGARYMISTVSFAGYLAHYARETLSMDPKDVGIGHMGLGAEPGAGIPEIRRALEDAWGAKVYDCMGTADFCPVLWTECSEQDGMHFVAGDFVIPEIVDLDTQEPLKLEEGATGELICTAIQRECVPLIRYRIGDVVTVVGDGPCRCGRGSIRIRCLDRADNMFIVRGVNVYPAAVVSSVARFIPEVSGAVQVVLKEPSVSQSPPIQVRVEMAEGYTDESSMESLKSRIEKALREELIFQADVGLLPYGEISGKTGTKRPVVVRP